MPIISRDSRRDNGDQTLSPGLTSWIGWKMEALQGPDRLLQLFLGFFSFVFLLVFVNNSQFLNSTNYLFLTLWLTCIVTRFRILYTLSFFIIIEDS